MSFYHVPESSDAHSSDTGVSGGGGGAEDVTFFGFFGGLLVSEAADRAPALQHVTQTLAQAARDERDERNGVPAMVASPGSVAPAQLLQAHLPQVLRLACTCPLEDVRDSMRALLQELAAIDAEYSKYVLALDFAFQPSNFVPREACIDPSGRVLGSPAPASAAAAATAGDDSAAADAVDADASVDTQTLLEDIFLSSGRVSHIDLLMAWHPSYLTLYAGATHFLMEDAGPLPTPWRNYLAIMAAARHHCDYLIALQESEFIAVGGDPAWLKGIANAPKKLQALCELNALLAHQPWLITPNHIATLTAGAGSDSWSVAELVHALVILSTFHALCGFVAGMGLRHEIDAFDWAAWDPAKSPAPLPLIRRNAPEAPPTPSHGAASTPLHSSTSAAAASASSQAVSPQQLPAKPAMSDGEHLLHLLSNSKGHFGHFSEHPSDGFNAAVEDSVARGPAELMLGEGLSGGPSSSSSSSSSSAPSHNNNGSSHPAGPLSTAGGLLRHPLHGPGGVGHLDPSAPASKYLCPPADAPNAAAALKLASMRTAQFDVNSKAYATFFLHDYSWKEHGFALVHRYYQGFASLIDQEWDTIFSLTYNTVSDATGVDTTPFRTAIWFLAHRLLGLQHDDFDYARIPVFLTNALKTLVRKLVCAPDGITAEDIELKGYNFKPDEKCHIVLLAIEARRQAALLYALHSVMKFMS